MSTTTARPPSAISTITTLEPRDQIAIAAMQAMLTAQLGLAQASKLGVAALAYEMADAMMAVSTLPPITYMLPSPAPLAPPAVPLSPDVSLATLQAPLASTLG